MRSITLIAVAALAASSHASDWPQFQGPHRNGVSDETGLVRSFPSEGPPVAWSAPIGPGFGGAAVRGDEVFLHDRVPEERDVLRCFDLETGRELWSVASDVKGRLPYKGSRGVPTVTADRVYTIGGFGRVACVDRGSHEVVWSRHLERDLEGELPKFGWSQSPLVHDGLVYVAPLGVVSGLVALDAKTGVEAWRSAPLGTSHSTPVLVELGGVEQIVFLTRREEGEGQLTGIDPKTGETLWRYEDYFVKRAIPAPIRLGDTQLFLTGGYRAGSRLLEVTRAPAETGGGWSFRNVFSTTRGAQIHLPLLHERHLYLIANENWNDRRPRHAEGGLLCLTLDGTEKWRTGDAPYLGRGGMILADGMLIVQDGQSGILRLVDPDPAGYRELASANIFAVEDATDDAMMWAPPALSNGRLLMRSQETLKCVDLRANPTAAHPAREPAREPRGPASLPRSDAP